MSAVQFGAKLYAPAENRAKIAKMVRAESEAGAALIVLPELAVSGYGLDPKGLAKSAENFDGPTLALLNGLSNELGVILVCGFCECEGNRLYNSAILTSPGIKPVLYRKLHLFDAEKDVFCPGDKGLVMAKTEIGMIGICVCYDLRFVEVARGLALAGADLLAVPTAWVGGFDKESRDGGGYIGQARSAVVQANLNQLPMVCASQSGGEQGLRFLGSSLIADAFGTTLAGPMGEDESGTIRAEISLAAIRNARVRSPRILPREDRRTDIYGVRVGDTTY